MSIPPWVRWLVATLVLAGVAAGGAAANLAVLRSGGDDTRLGTLSARALAPSGHLPDAAATPAPVTPPASSTYRDDGAEGTRDDGHHPGEPDADD